MTIAVGTSIWSATRGTALEAAWQPALETLLRRRRMKASVRARISAIGDVE